MKQKLTIFGANLRDQSKGQFVVHAADCADCKKLARETQDTAEFSTVTEVVKYVWADILNGGSSSFNDCLGEMHFAPCVTIPTESSEDPYADNSVHGKNANL